MFLPNFANLPQVSRTLGKSAIINILIAQCSKIFQRLVADALVEIKTTKLSQMLLQVAVRGQRNKILAEYRKLEFEGTPLGSRIDNDIFRAMYQLIF